MSFFKSEKEKLMGLLDDANVREKLRRIVLQPHNILEDSGKSAIEEEENTSAKAMESDDVNPLKRAQKAEPELVKVRSELIKAQNNLKAAEQNKTDLVRAKRELSDAQKKAATLETQVLGLEAHKLTLAKELDSVKSGFANAQTECNQLSSQNRETRVELANVQDKLLQYESSMSGFNKIFDLYNGLPGRVKDGLQGIFNGSSLHAFIICGVQKDNLFTLWDYCKTEFDRGKMEAHDSLLAIFQFFFDLVKQSVSGTFLYEIQTVSIGDAFNKDLHTVAGMGVASGKIASVILPGIVYTTNQKIFKKSLVEVR